MRTFIRSAGWLISDGSSGDSLINRAAGTISYNGTSGNSATLSVPVTDSGAIHVGGGTLNIAGAFTPAGTASLAIGISGRATYGQLAVTGTARMAGTLNIQTARNYLPPVGTTIKIMSATKRTGTFSNITGKVLSGEHWVVSYTSTNVTLKAVSG